MLLLRLFEIQGISEEIQRQACQYYARLGHVPSVANFFVLWLARLHTLGVLFGA